MKRVLPIVLIVVVALIAALAAVPFLIPADQYRTRIEAAASEALGREFKVNGGMRFALWPAVGVTAKEVTIANAPGGVAPLFASVDQLDIGVKVMPLLKGDVQVEKLVLKKPTLALEADVRGKPNWIFEPATKKTGQPSKTGEQEPLKQLGLGDVRIADGSLTFRDKTGKVQAIDSLAATLSLESLDAPFALDGQFNYAGDLVKIGLGVVQPRAVLSKAPTPLKLTIDSPKLTAALDGALDPKTFAVTGKVDAKGSSVRRLAAWTGSPIGDGGGLGPFEITGDLKMEGATTTLSNASIALDQAKGRGDIAITAADGVPPYVKATLALQSLDINPYLAPPQTAEGAPAAKGVDVNQGWSAERIDLSGLKALNADLDITTGQLLFQKMKMDRATLNVALKDGVLKANLKKLEMYGGAGSGALTLDARGDALKIEQRLIVTGLSAKPFLTDAIGFSKIEGRGKLDATISGAGASQQAIMQSLSGAGSFVFEDGALTGVNLAQIARQVQSVLSGQAIGPAAKTDFAEMGASFKIAGGEATTKDLRMLNPFVRITGEGVIDLAAQTMNMKITPKAVKTIEGQGGKQDVGGIGVPFRIQGPWSKLSYKPDLAGMVQDRIQSELDKALGGKGLSGLLPGAKKEGEAPAKSPLDGLFKRP